MRKRDKCDATGGKSSLVRKGKGTGGWCARCILTANAFYKRSAQTAGARRSDPFQLPLQKIDKRGRRGGCDDLNTNQWKWHTLVRHGLPAPPPSCSPTHVSYPPCCSPPPPRRVAPPLRAYVTRTRTRTTRAYVFRRTVLSLRARREVDEVKAKQARAHSYWLITN